MVNSIFDWCAYAGPLGRYSGHHLQSNQCMDLCNHLAHSDHRDDCHYHSTGADHSKIIKISSSVWHPLLSQKGSPMQKILLAIAVIAGLFYAYVDSRPTWDDTGITVGIIL